MGLKRPYFPPRQTIFPGINSVVSTNVTAGPGGATPVTGSSSNAYNSSIVRLSGMVPSYLNALGTNYWSNNASGVNGGGAQAYAVEFEGYFDDIALVFRNNAASSYFWLWCNDPATGAFLPVTSAPVASTAANPNNQFYYRITFGAVAQRQCRLYCYQADYGGMYVKPTQTLVPTAAPQRQICVIGDSYCAGALAITSLTTWPQSLGRLLGTDVFINAVGGTGYAQVNGSVGGNNNYSSSTRIASAIATGASDFILAGSINDSGQTPAAVTAAAQALISGIKAAVPNARFWMTGLQGLPITGGTFGNNAANNAALSAVAASYNIPFIDTVSGWFTGTGYVTTPTGNGNRDYFLNTDQTHPTQAGHDYLASRMYQTLISLGW